MRRQPPRLKVLARDLRRRQTDAERILWHHLRDKRLKGTKFRRQQPIGPYIVDFCCPEHRLIIELDGGQHTKEHERARDKRRTDYLESQGYRVVRFWDNQVLTETDGVLRKITAELEDAPPISLSKGAEE